MMAKLQPEGVVFGQRLREPANGALSLPDGARKPLRIESPIHQRARTWREGAESHDDPAIGRSAGVPTDGSNQSLRPRVAEITQQVKPLLRFLVVVYLRSQRGPPPRGAVVGDVGVNSSAASTKNRVANCTAVTLDGRDR